MAPNPPDFLNHLTAEGYHPRSDKHSNALALAIVRDLVARCSPIAESARAGHLVFDLNFTIIAGTAQWNVDLVLGEPPPGVAAPNPEDPMTRTRPSRVQIAIEIKSVMTEHRKAIKNRKRDFEAHHDHVHRYSRQAIAAGVLVVNQSPTFRSPLRPSLTTHRQPAALVDHCVNEMRAVAERRDNADIGLDAKAVLVVSLDNVDARNTRYETRPPAPQVGDPMHYDAFLDKICELWASAFARS